MREPLPAPSRIPPFPTGLIGAGALPASVHSLYESAGAACALEALARLTAVGVPDLVLGDPQRTAFPFRGGEGEGLRRLQEYLHGQPGLGDLSLQDASHSDAVHGQGDGGFVATNAARAHDRDREACSGAGMARGREACEPHGQHTAGSGQPAAVAGGAYCADPPPQEGRGSATAGESGRQGAQGGAAGRPPIHSFRDTRMGAVGVDNSLKLSAFLAAGCLSARTVHAMVAAAREAHGEDTGHSWVVMHLTIRSFPCWQRNNALSCIGVKNLRSPPRRCSAERSAAELPELQWGRWKSWSRKAQPRTLCATSAKPYPCSWRRQSNVIDSWLCINYIP